MTTLFKPMLACEADLTKLRFPLLASPKLDGIRAIVRDGVVFSRSNKPIPNKFVQEQFNTFEYFDGELIVGDPTAHDVYRQTTSHVMSQDKVDFPVKFFAFDHIENLAESYDKRVFKIGKRLPSKVVLHKQYEVESLDHLIRIEEVCLTQGYEGLILRDFNAPYKCGRSTVNEGYLLKLKRFSDAEAIVIGFEERMRNDNEAVISELGRTKRSSHKANKHGRGDLGALVCRTGDGVEFNIGTGFDDLQRAAIWANRDNVLGQFAKFKFFPVGVKEAPRHPVFLGWRDVRDM